MLFLFLFSISFFEKDGAFLFFFPLLTSLRSPFLPPQLDQEMVLLETDGNPFTSYLAALGQVFNRPHHRGFGIRLAVLSALCAIGIVISSTALVLQLSGAVRRPDATLWLFRRVTRGKGSYLVINVKLVSSLMGVIALAVQLQFLHNAYLAYLRHSSEAAIAAWQTLPAFVLVLHGWLASWGIYQKYLVGTSDELSVDNHRVDLIPGPKKANFIFVAGGVIGFIGVMISGSVNVVRGHELWVQFVSVADELKAREASWIAGNTVTIASMLSIAPSLGQLSSAYDNFKTSGIVAWSLTAVMLSSMVIVNLSSLALASVFCQEIGLKIRSTSTPDVLSATGIEGASHKRSHIRQRLVSRLFRAGNILQPSNSSEEGDLPLEDSILVARLRKAERELVMMSSGVLSSVVLSLAFCLFFTRSLSNSSIFTLSRGTFEAMLFGLNWIYASTVVVAHIIICYNLLHQLPPQCHESVPADPATIYEEETASASDSESDVTPSSSQSKNQGARWKSIFARRGEVRI